MPLPRCPNPDARTLIFGKGTYARHWRLCELTDPEHPDYNPAWVAEVARLVHGAPHAMMAAAPEEAPAPPTAFADRQLVVAAYHEDLNWLTKVPCPVMVYAKGGKCFPGVPCVTLPNTQREAGTILTHIVTRWDQLAPLTIFCQGEPFEHSPDFLARLEAAYDQPTSLTTQYQDTVPPDWIKAQDLVEQVGGFEVRYGNATIKDHGNTNEQGWFDPGAWKYVFDCPMPDPLWFGYAATWAVPRASIQARPREFYAHLLEVCDSGTSGLSHTDPPINPWSLEALWRYIFSDPVTYPHRVYWPGRRLLSVTEVRDLTARMKACRHYVPKKSCCDGASCKLGKGSGGWVHVSECFACLQEQDVTGNVL